jgi:SAM-dependent methyltransferase
MSAPEPSFADGREHFADRGAEFLEFYRKTAPGRIYVECLRRRIAGLLPLGRHVEILDLGGGVGYITAPFASDGHRITLLDRDETLLRIARGLIDEMGLASKYEIIQGDMESLVNLESDSYEVVLNFSALGHCEFPMNAIAEMVRVCRPAGSMLIVAANYLATLKTGMKRGDLEASRRLLDEGIFEAVDNDRAYLVRAFSADELWGYFNAAGAQVEYVKADRILTLLLGDEGLEELAKAWGLEACIDIELRLDDDPALAGAGLGYCVLAKM